MEPPDQLQPRCRRWDRLKMIKMVPHSSGRQEAAGEGGGAL